jgi:Tfp pilus assembly protein PilF
MNIINFHNFKHTLKDIHKNTENRKFCFILGAGASYNSGIPTGSKLSEKWFKEIGERNTKGQIEKWINEEKIDIKDLASHYGIIYRKRFETDKTSGYEFLVQAMRTAKPTFGHFVLAQILTKAPGHCILTTNFDSLIESAIYQYTDKTPLVCGHESLSGYARPSNIHPLIIKIHRDLLLSPKNDPSEINTLDQGWREPLDNIFSSHIPIVIGYGGNDGSLMEYFKEMNKPSNFFWCGRQASKTSKKVQELITNMDGSFVEIDGFDEMMQELLWVFDEIKPIKEELESITKSRISGINEQMINMNPKSKTLSRSFKFQKELSAFEFKMMADNEPDFEKRKLIYLNAVEQFPTTDWLYANFTYFLHFVKKDFQDLEKYYKEALSFNTTDPALPHNYAKFLSEIKFDHENAEKYFLNALSIEPDNAIINGTYALFLEEIKDTKKAEAFHKKAISINPMEVMLVGNYANFLAFKTNDILKAEKYYLKAIELDGQNSTLYSNYGVFLCDIKEDYLKAENHYKLALGITPDFALVHGNYSIMLFLTERFEEGKFFMGKAFGFNNGERNGLLITLWFYKYAFDYDQSQEAKQEITLLIKEGVFSKEEQLDKTVRIAIQNGHPEPDELKELAIKIIKQ